MDLGAEEDPRKQAFREMYLQSEAAIATLFGCSGAEDGGDAKETPSQAAPDLGIHVDEPSHSAPPKKSARTIDEDDYGDDDDEDTQSGAENVSPLKTKSKTPMPLPLLAGSLPSRPSAPSSRLGDSTKGASPRDQGKTTEEVRKRLEEDRKATEDAAKRSFHTLFYTLENDRVAMLEQQKLEESERQVDAEMGHGGNSNATGSTSAPNSGQQGKLSSANLGASSLTLKHLIARIDAKRDQVRASDAELRTLMSEVRKNRSKWANEERVGQEELYEAAEKVLSELKALTEYSAPFLSRVNKREAPDYYSSKLPNQTSPSLEAVQVQS
jgi:transcriptional activator SPT7